MMQTPDQSIVSRIYGHGRGWAFSQQDLSYLAGRSTTDWTLAGEFGRSIQPSGATALQLMGLSTQVPGRMVYLSDGPSRTNRIGNTELAFARATLKEAKFKHRESGLTIE